MILYGNLLLPHHSEFVSLQTGWIEVLEGRIQRVEAGEPEKDWDYGGPGFLISPGFVDTHLHLPQIDCFGAYGMNLLDWLERVVFPAEMAWSNPDHARRRATSAIDQLLGVGTTSFLAFTSNHLAGAIACLETIQQLGLRASVGQALSDQEIPSLLRLSTQQNLTQAAELIEQFPPGERASAAIAPRFAITCSPELLAGCGELGAKTGALMETHLAETFPECERACALHQASDYFAIYEKAGIAGPKAFHGHCIHLSDREQQAMAGSHTPVAHCPTSNSFLRSGTMNRAAWKRAGIPVGLGSDIAAGYEKSMIRTARSMLEVSFFVDESPPPAAEAWWQITKGNADLLGWHDTGRIEPGASADLLLISPPHRWLNTYQPLSDLLWTWDDRWLKATIVQGNLLYRSGALKSK